MSKSKVVGFNSTKLFDEMMKDIIKQQRALFVDYAEKTIKDVGDTIKTYHSRNNMDRTGNLLDSLCWGVSYQGKLMDSGFYRPAQASMESGLHEWSSASFRDKYGTFADRINADTPVNGHQLAQEYIERAGNLSHKGWKVFFAILAPYWGYWEKGFTLRTGFGAKKNERFLQFSVMSQFYDKVKADLKPSRVRFNVSVANYASKSLFAQAKKTWYGK